MSIESGKYWVDWTEYESLLDQLIAQIKESDFIPDLILGISRGGLPVADALTRAFSKPMAVIAASSYKGAGEVSQGQLEVSEHIATLHPLAGKVLLVDDLVDSGLTLKALAMQLKSRHSDVVDLKTAVLWAKPNSKFKPDFRAVELEHDLWIVQPFEKREFK